MTMMTSWNITTTQTTLTDFVSTLLFTTLQQTFEDSDFKEPGSKGPKGPKGPGGEPLSHSQNLEWKQALAILSIIFISLFIILSLLQIKIHNKCYSNCRRTQCSSISGKILFTLFMISLLMFLMNSITFVHFIFNMDELSTTQYALSLIFSMIPYRIGKLCMSLFFILRLHFVFSVSALRINVYIIVILSILSSIGSILGCVSGAMGPLKVVRWGPESEGIHPVLAMSYVALGITILVDIIVMIYYVSTLISVVVMQADVSYIATKRAETVATNTDTTIELVTNANGETEQLTEGEMDVKSEDAYDDDDDDEVLKPKVAINLKFVDTITKSTLLSLIGILTSFWLHLEYLIKAIEGDTDGVLFRGIASVDGAINVICMYLVFAFAKPYYNFGCKLCHNAMSKCCVFVTKKAIIKAKQNDQGVK